MNKWTEEARKALDELEEKFDIEVVSIEHHEVIHLELNQLQSDLHIAKQALKKYGVHLEDCHTMRPGHFLTGTAIYDENEECTCGLDKTLNDINKETK